MEPDLNTAVGLIAAVTSVVSFALGYLLERSALGMIALGALTTIACGLCYLGVLLGGPLGLLAAMVLVAILAIQVGARLGSRRGSVFMPTLWLGFCASCGTGYWAGGLLGLLTVTLPGLVIFWGALIAVSSCLLPLSAPGQRGKAFRSLLAFCLGTNRPFFMHDGRNLEEHVPGNPFGQFLAGHGIVLTRPTHAPVIWTGVKFLRTAKPGLTFTDRFESVYQTLDLRPQLRSFAAEALSRDGIRIRVTLHIAFKLHVESQEVRLGSGFPFDQGPVYEAIWRQPVEEGRICSWDDCVKISATRLIRRILGGYRVDQLTEALNLLERPRESIQNDLLRRLCDEMDDFGIDIIECWFENLEPVDASVITERTEAWKSEWTRKISITEGQAQAAALVEIEQARARAQAELIEAVGHVVELQPPISPDALASMAALRFIEALEEVGSAPDVRESAPESAYETIDLVRKLLARDKAEA